MAPAQRDDIAVVDGRLTVRDFQTDAADIVSYFEGIGAGDIARRFEDGHRSAKVYRYRGRHQPCREGV